MTDLEDRVRATLREAAATTVVPAVPTLAPAGGSRSPRRRRAAAILIVALVPASGALAAADYLPGSLDKVFSFPDDRGSGPSALQRLGAVPGPAGQRFELWTRPGDSGSTCFLSAIVPNEQPADRPARQVTESVGFCADTDGASSRFGSNGGGSETTFNYDAGTAVRAEVRFTDGTRLPAVVAAGHVGGWVPPDRRSDAVLVGYDNTGKIVATVDLTPWDPPPPTVRQ